MRTGKVNQPSLGEKTSGFLSLKCYHRNTECSHDFIRIRMHARAAFPIPLHGIISMIKVDHYKYLGVWLSHNLSWLKHIEETCKGASKQIGLIYRLFCLHSSQATLRSLYVSLVRSKLEYAAPVWDPQQSTLCHTLEKTKKFALKVFTKNWSSYANHLNLTNLP